MGLLLGNECIAYYGLSASEKSGRTMVLSSSNLRKNLYARFSAPSRCLSSTQPGSAPFR